MRPLGLSAPRPGAHSPKDCGLKTRSTEESEAKLKVLVDAVGDIKRELEID